MKKHDQYSLYWMNEISQKNMLKLIKHCDKKIDDYFAALDKKIAKIVKDEVKRLVKK